MNGVTGDCVPCFSDWYQRLDPVFVESIDSSHWVAILLRCRRSLNVSIGLDEASCPGLWFYPNFLVLFCLSFGTYRALRGLTVLPNTWFNGLGYLRRNSACMWGNKLKCRRKCRLRWHPASDRPVVVLLSVRRFGLCTLGRPDAVRGYCLRPSTLGDCSCCRTPKRFAHKSLVRTRKE